MKSNTKSFYHLTFSSCTTDFRTPLSTFGVGSALDSNIEAISCAKEFVSSRFKIWSYLFKIGCENLLMNRED
ncbi:hypothetical protein FWJ33_04575 [Leptospira interrogans serovar Hardjo]|nr:hypothetical protein FWJ33_04575 [Leptospira interrogans serovar Hardjo]